jgi:hypothetical protein
MKLKVNDMVVKGLLLMAFDLDAKTQTPTALIEAKLLPEGYPAVRLRMRSEVTRWNNNR